jgi:O-antigen/teichoic acid export membrane protein
MADLLDASRIAQHRLRRNVSTPVLDERTTATRWAASHRDRRARVTSVSGVAARLIAFASTALLVPITVVHLGAERYGVWMAMLAVLTVLSLSDAGVGNALVSRVAAADAREDRLETAQDVSTAVAVAACLSTGLGVLACVLALTLPTHELFDLQSTSPHASDVRSAALVLLVAAMARISLDLIVNLRSGLQEGHVNAAFDIGASLVRVVAVAVAVAMGSGLTGVVVAASVAPIVASAANWLLLIRTRPHTRPRRGLVTAARARALVRGGSLFLILQIAMVVGYSSDNLVGARVLGPAAVTQYAVPSQLALGAIGLLSMLSMPLWPAYADAAARGDWWWIRRAFRRSLRTVAIASAAAAVALVVVGGPAVRAWSGGVVRPSAALLCGFAVWILLSSLGTAVAALLNALHVMRVQVVCASAMAASNIVLSVFLAQRFGVSGLIWGTVASYVVTVVLPFGIVVPRVISHRQRAGESGG